MARPTYPVLLTRRDAADGLGISVDTLVRLLDRGELRAVRIGRSVLVPESEVNSFVERRLSETADTPPRAEAES